MSGGIIIQRRQAIKTVVNDSAIKGVLPGWCQTKIDSISAKGLPDWTDEEENFMASMPLAAIHC